MRAIVVRGQKRGPAARQRRSCNEEVYHRLKSMILSNRVRPGWKLVHQDLAEQFAVSRTPVREALERLYQEGLVTRARNRGFFVAEIDAQEAEDLYETREALETFALRQTFEQGAVSAARLRRLKDIFAVYERLAARDADPERAIYDRDFHLELASLSGNRYLVKMLESVFERLILKRRADGYRSARAMVAVRQHRALLEAIEEGKARKADAILRAHIRQAKDHLLAYLRETGSI